MADEETKGTLETQDEPDARDAADAPAAQDELDTAAAQDVTDAPIAQDELDAAAAQDVPDAPIAQDAADAPIDFSQYIEDIDDEYEFDEEPVVEPAKPEPPKKTPMSPVVSYHRKTLRNSYMLAIGGAAVAVFGAFIVGKGGFSTFIGIFLAILGLGVCAVGLLSVSRTKKLIRAAQRTFARDRAVRIYQKCADAGIEDSKSEENQAGIMKVAFAFGFDKKSEAIGLYDAGRTLVLKGEKPNPDFDDV